MEKFYFIIAVIITISLLIFSIYLRINENKVEKKNEVDKVKEKNDNVIKPFIHNEYCEYPNETLISVKGVDEDDDKLYCNNEQMVLANHLGYKGNGLLTDIREWFNQIGYSARIDMKTFEIDWDYKKDGSYSHSHKSFNEAAGILVSRTLADIDFDLFHEILTK